MAKNAASDKTLSARQDELIEELLGILRLQLDGQETLDSAQYRELQAAIANYKIIARTDREIAAESACRSARASCLRPSPP